MRSASAPLLAHLGALRSGDAQTIAANLFTFILLQGSILRYTDFDLSIVSEAETYVANSVLVSGLRYKSSVGLEVDQQHIVISANPEHTIFDRPFLQAMREGVFDGCRVQRHLAFLSEDLTAIGTVQLFIGRFGTLDRVGMSTAELTVNSDLVILDIDMPRRMYSPNCQHVLYDAGCGVDKNAHKASGVVEAGSTVVRINWTGAADHFKQGRLIFTSGAHNGASATVKDVGSGVLVLSYPLIGAAPAAGDTFDVYQGCDHTVATCESRFSNKPNFFGFPYIPSPTNAI